MGYYILGKIAIDWLFDLQKLKLKESSPVGPSKGYGKAKWEV